MIQHIKLTFLAFAFIVIGCGAENSLPAKADVISQNNAANSTPKIKTDSIYLYSKTASFYAVQDKPFGSSNAREIHIDSNKIELVNNCSVNIKATITPFEADANIKHLLHDAGSYNALNLFLKKNFNSYLEDILVSYETEPDMTNSHCPLNYTAIYQLKNGNLLINNGDFYLFTKSTKSNQLEKVSDNLNDETKKFFEYNDKKYLTLPVPIKFFDFMACDKKLKCIPRTSYKKYFHVPNADLDSLIRDIATKVSNECFGVGMGGAIVFLPVTDGLAFISSFTEENEQDYWFLVSHADDGKSTCVNFGLGSTFSIDKDLKFTVKAFNDSGKLKAHHYQVQSNGGVFQID